MALPIINVGEARRLTVTVETSVRVRGADGEVVVDADGHAVEEPRRWDLWDDVPMEAMLGCFELLDELNAAPDEGGMAAVRARFEAEERVYLDVLLAIFQHAYPRTTREDLRVWLDHAKRKEIVEAFFALRGGSSSTPATPPPDSAPTSTPNTRTSSPASATASPTGATPNRATPNRVAPNRATRRQATKTAARSTSGTS